MRTADRRGNMPRNTHLARTAAAVVEPRRRRLAGHRRAGPAARARPGPSAKTKARQWWPAGFFFALHVC